MNRRSLAPELSRELEWVNCEPLEMTGLRGRVVALAFWHADSALCANLLAELTALQVRYADGLTVIALHTPKFDMQRDPAHVLRAINALGVRFPAASDAAAIAWQHFGVRSWPSVVLVDALGRISEIVAGDRQQGFLDERIRALLDEAGASGVRNFENAQPASRPEELHAVLFPRGLAWSPDSLYVSDSGHHRILECDHDGRVLRVFGTGSTGFADGLGEEASFRFPGGLALDRGELYVADTGNHAIRRVHLATGEVETVLGTGEPGTPVESRDARQASVALDRPWDVVVGRDRLYVSLAAGNQIWELDLRGHGLRLLAGSGRLGLADGQGALAALAQPSGLAFTSERLYACDSQASAVRTVELASGEVGTLIGQGMYEFGSEEGDRDLARLQCPLGVAVDPESPMLWIADSGNDALGAWHLEGGGLIRFPLEHPLRMPSALHSDGEHLWIANTHAHEVLRFAIRSGETTVLPMMR